MKYKRILLKLSGESLAGEAQKGIDFDKVLSLDLLENENTQESSDVDSEMEQYINEMISKRAEAKKAKDFATADAIREELAAKGIVLKDTREGTTWTKA